MGRRRTACTVCASIKTLCSQGRPCARCKRLSLSCTYDAPPAHLGDRLGDQAEIGATSSLVRTRRSRKGCAQCHRRHKKCDEQQPDCGDCRRLGLQCVPRASSTAGGCSPDETPIISHSNTKALPPEPFRDWISLVERKTTTPVVSKPSSLASSVALVDFPIPARHDEAEYATFLPPTALSNMAGITPEALKSWSIGERHLLNHFLQSVSRALVLVGDENNPFIRVAVPMALQSEVVKHGLVSLSACHLSSVYPAFQADLFRHRGYVLQSIRESIEYDDFVIDDIMAIMLQCLAEICTGSSRTWHLYLHGSHAILKRMGAGVMDEPGSQFVTQLYSYLQYISSATAEQVPPGLPPELAQHSSTPGKLHPLLGFAESLYRMLPSVSRLGIDIRQPYATSDSVGDNLTAQEIELSLQSWCPSDLTNSDRLTSEAEAAAFATQRAMLLWLTQATHTLKSDDLRVTRAADNILSALSLIRPGSEIEARTLFPLFMAGIGSKTKANRLTVEYRLNIMETTVGFGHIFTAHKFLEEFWQRSNEGEDVDWRLLMRVNYAGLVLF